MKLEIKHLAPYLPYKLNLHTNLSTSCQYFGITYIDDVLDLDNCSKVFTAIRTKQKDKEQGFSDSDDLYLKPILRPLSELPEFLEKSLYVEQWHDEWIAHISDFQDKIHEANILACPYDLYEYLISQHFDVFGLIPEGLAVDINQVKIKS